MIRVPRRLSLRHERADDTETVNVGLNFGNTVFRREYSL